MKTLLFTLALALASCASPNNSRSLSSAPVVAEVAEKSLNGTFLGVAQYETGHKGPNKAAARIYLQEIEGEKGKYNVIILEYVNLLGMAPSYVAASKLPKISKATKYLRYITKTVAAYRMNPSAEVGSYELWPLVVVDGKIEAKVDGKPRVLTLSKNDNLSYPLEGATITGSRKEDPKELFFPGPKDGKRNGIQYGIANFTYSKVKLESTWRKKFLTGPYLSAYGNLTDVVLQLSKSEDKTQNFAEFKINPAYAALTEKKRSSMFTNEKSAFLNGKFTVSEPVDGMFVMSSDSDSKSATEVKGRIGLFIDIFDATKALNQDVVEIAFVDSEHPEDFLMYYEHPDNGEGN